MHFKTRDTSKVDLFTQRCRDLIRTFTYEDILACTVYAPPMFFMVGPAAVVANNPVISLVVTSSLGFALAWTLHRMGHRLFVSLPNEPQKIYISRTWCLPVKLTLPQFLWTMELIVGAAVFSGVLGKQFFVPNDTFDLLTSLSCFALALVLFFVPVHLGRLWIEKHYPAMTLLGPTEAVINKSFPGVRSIFK